MNAGFGHGGLPSQHKSACPLCEQFQVGVGVSVDVGVSLDVFVCTNVV